MRVLFVNQYFPPDASATAYILGELAEDLAGHHEVHVVAGRPSYNANSSVFKPQGVHVRRALATSFNRSSIAGRITNYVTFLLGSALIGVRSERPDVVVTLTDPPVVGLIGLIIARRFHCPFVFVSHDVHPDIGIALGRLDNPLIVWILRMINRLMRRKAAHIIVVGRDMMDKMVREGVPPNKITYLPNWANPSEPVSMDELRARLGWSDRFVVMHAGNMGLAQNLGVAVAAAGLLADRPEILFVLMGDGAGRGALEAETNRLGLQNVVFEPYRPKAAAQEIVGAADVHLVTLAPGLHGCAAPSKVYGIMATGRPFIAAVDEESEPHLVIRDHNCGIRVAPNDAEALAAAISEMDPKTAGEMGSRALAAFHSNFSRSIVTDAYRTALESVSAKLE